MCHINPRVDFAFKKLFGSEENKDLLLSLLNAILDWERPVVDLTLKNPYNLAAYRSGKMSILDIKARDELGVWFNVEMQIGQDLNFDKRAIYYWAKLVTEQLTEGMMYKQLEKTVSINILDFDVVPDNDEMHNIYKIINTRTKKDDKLHDVFELHYVELRKFTKGFAEITTALDRWATFLTRAYALDKDNLPPQLAEDLAIIKAVNAVDRMFNEEERKIYEDRMLVLADVQSKIDSALTKGLEQGLEKGMEQGLKKGMEQGLEKGTLETQRKIVLQARQMGMDAATIATLVTMPLPQIEKILQEADSCK